MSWVLYKNNISEILEERLDNNKYPNSSHILLNSIFAKNLLECFPENNSYLAEYVVENNCLIACVLGE